MIRNCDSLIRNEGGCTLYTVCVCQREKDKVEDKCHSTSIVIYCAWRSLSLYMCNDFVIFIKTPRRHHQHLATVAPIISTKSQQLPCFSSDHSVLIIFTHFSFCRYCRIFTIWLRWGTVTPVIRNAKESCTSSMTSGSLEWMGSVSFMKMYNIITYSITWYGFFINYCSEILFPRHVDTHIP